MIGEGNGNPPHCSCLENPKDGGAWCAAVYGVTWSRTRLKWLSSSSSSEKVKIKVAVRVWLFVTPIDYKIHWIVQARILEGIDIPFSRDLPNPGMKLRSLALQVDSLPAEPQGKPKNTGVGNLSLLQRIFPTKESNQNLLHCRQILYQLSYQGSPRTIEEVI